MNTLAGIKALFWKAKDFESIRLQPTETFTEATYRHSINRQFVRGIFVSIVPGCVYLGFVYISASLALELTLVNVILFAVLALLFSLISLSDQLTLGMVQYRTIFSTMKDMVIPHVMAGNKEIIDTFQTRLGWAMGVGGATLSVYRVAVYCWVVVGSLVVFAVTYDIYFSLALLAAVGVQVVYTITNSMVMFRLFMRIGEHFGKFEGGIKTFVELWTGLSADPRKMITAKNQVRAPYVNIQALTLKTAAINNTIDAVVVATIPVILAFIAKLFHSAMTDNAFPFSAFLTATYLIRDAITNFSMANAIFAVKADVNLLLNIPADPAYNPDCVRPAADGEVAFVHVDGKFSWKAARDDDGGDALPTALTSTPTKRGTLNAKTVDLVWSVAFDAKDRDLLLMVGGQGAGKTSLCDMLMGYMVERAGTRELRGKLCLVPQTPLIFGATIKENVTLDQAWEPNLFLRIIKSVGLDKDFKVTESSWDRSVGARGSGLSSGQRVRVGAARAAYHGPQIILIDSLLDALDQRVAASVMQSYVCGLLGRSIRIVCVAETTFKVPSAHRTYSIDMMTNTFEALDTAYVDEGGVAGLSLLQLDGAVSGNEVGTELAEMAGDGILGVKGALKWTLTAVNSSFILIVLVGLSFLRGMIFSLVYQIGTIPSDPVADFVTYSVVIMTVAYVGGSILGMVISNVTPLLGVRWFKYVIDTVEASSVAAFRSKPLASRQALFLFYLLTMVSSTLPLLMQSISVISNAVSLMLNIATVAPEFGGFLLLYAVLATYYLNTRLDMVARVAQRDTIVYEELTDDWDEYGAGFAEMQLYGSKPSLERLHMLCSLTYSQVIYMGSVNVLAGVVVFHLVTAGFLVFAFATDLSDYALTFSLLIGVTNTAPKMMTFGVLAAIELGIVPRFMQQMLELEEDVATGSTLPQSPFVLEATNVWLSARDTRLVKGVSVRFEEFARCVIIGRTGSGKSLLASSLVRLDGLDLTEGRISFGGVDVSATRRKIITSFVRYMPATPCLVGDNLADFLLRTPENEAEIVRLCALVGLLDSDDVEQVEVLQSTSIDDVTHSEKQALSAVRLLVANDFLCAVLDEFTSSLFDDAEDLVLGEVANLPTSVIMIHHRLQATWRMSHVAEMSDGHLLYHSTMASALSKPHPDSLLASIAPELKDDPNLTAPAACTMCSAKPPVARLVSTGTDSKAQWKCATCLRS